MKKRWPSWLEMEEQYREGVLALRKVRERMKAENHQDTVADREIMGGMIRDLEETAKVLKTKVLYEFGSLSENELALLTDRQREIAELRQRYTYRDIAKMLDISPKTAFDIFQKAVRNVKKIKRQRKEGLPAGLSPQQEQIYILHSQGKKAKEIAIEIGSTYSNVRYQLAAIKKKMLVKSQEN